MKPKLQHTEEEDVRYRKLGAIDAKCGSLLQLTSVLLVFISMPPIFETLRVQHAFFCKLIFIALLIFCIISLFVLYFKEVTSEEFVNYRKHLLNLAVCVTGICCLSVTVIVAVCL